MVTLHAAFIAFALAGAEETVLLEFTADWCGYCRMMEEPVARLREQGFPIQEVDFDRQKSLARQYNVSSLPCFVLLVDGREVARRESAVSAAELESMFRQAGVAPAPRAPAARPKRALRGQSPDSQARGNRSPGSRSSGAAPREPAEEFLPTHTSEGPFSGEEPMPVSQGKARRKSPLRTSRSNPLHDLALAASVRLKITDPNGASNGSGTIVDCRQGEALVLTCGHIFRDSQGKGAIRIDTFGARPEAGLPGELISYDIESDVALVAFRPRQRVGVARVAPADYVIRQGDPVVGAGCSHGADPTARNSTIASINKYAGPANLQVAGQPESGRSGGGLFTERGQVIGVCNAADPSDNEGLFASLATIHEELAEADLLEWCLDEGAGRGGDANQVAADDDVPDMPDDMPSASGRRLPPRLLDTSEEQYDEDVEPAAYEDAGNERPSPRRDARAAADDLAAAGDDKPDDSFSDEERAVLEEISSRADDAEVICIVRSRKDPRARSEIIVLDEASPEFVERLAGLENGQKKRATKRAPSRR